MKLEVPLFLWTGVWAFTYAVFVFLTYELYAVFTKRVPTISAFVRPNVHAWFVGSIIIGALFMLFLGFLWWDWFVAKFQAMLVR